MRSSRTRSTFINSTCTRSGLPDTYQTDHIDPGFRVDAPYGMDYRFPTMKRHFHRAPP
jgi:hypothetical protein